MAVYRVWGFAPLHSLFDKKKEEIIAVPLSFLSWRERDQRKEAEGRKERGKEGLWLFNDVFLLFFGWVFGARRG